MQDGLKHHAGWVKKCSADKNVNTYINVPFLPYNLQFFFFLIFGITFLFEHLLYNFPNVKKQIETLGLSRHF